MSINNNGHVGIGTTSPTTALQIGNFNNGTTNNQLLIPGTYNFEQIRLGQTGNGNGALEFVNHSSTSNSYGVRFAINTDIMQGLQIQYAAGASAYSNLSYTTGLCMTLSGKVGIGTIQPDEKLTVNGTIHATEVKVTATVPVPDYVFEENYQLKNLKELQEYVTKNKHLPEIPSATEMEKSGINLSEMNLKLLKKVEELTLYLIEKDKENKEQQDEINQKTKANSNR